MAKFITLLGQDKGLMLLNVGEIAAVSEYSPIRENGEAIPIREVTMRADKFSFLVREDVNQIMDAIRRAEEV